MSSENIRSSSGDAAQEKTKEGSKQGETQFTTKTGAFNGFTPLQC
jgi:hypothetical protein